MQSLYVIDASGYLYRSYHAIRNLTNAKGESTNALYGFIRSLMKLIKDFHPEHLVAVFDAPGGSQKRTQLYPLYKANRAAMPADLSYQIAWSQKYCDLIGIPKLVIPNVEADDAIGSIACWASEKGTNVYLCSSDKDLAQLVTDHVFLLNTHKNNLLLDSTQVEETFGIPPQKMVDYLAITGDASDNIPGIAGFGPKTALNLLQEFGSLENIFENIEKVPGKKREILKKERQTALISKSLVEIDKTVTIPKEEAFFLLRNPPDRGKVIEFYKYMNFTSLLKEVSGEESQSEKEELDYILVDEEEALKELFEHLQKTGLISFDTETSHVKPKQAHLVGVGFCTEEKKAWYVPTNGKLGLKRVLQFLKDLTTDETIQFFGHNIKYDWHVLQTYGLTLKNIAFDTILASYILNSHKRQHSLDALCLEFFGKVKTPIKDLIGNGKKAVSMLDVPIEKVKNYCCEDVDYTFRLKTLFEKELISRNLNKLFFDLELPLLQVLAKMEHKGIYLDIDHLKEMKIEIGAKLLQLEDEIYAMAERPFNIKSPKQLSELLFIEMGIPAPKKTATGYSTSADVLEILRDKYPIANTILQYRTVEKLRSTYVDTLPNEVNPQTKRIHPTFNQFVTATGRLSCQDPNLQNIPVRTKIGRQIRQAFRPEFANWSFLSADYSQIELRLLAHFSEDPQLIKAFENDEDVHSFTASLILDKSLKDVTKEERYQAKAVNFGIIYGQQAFGLSRELNITLPAASNFIRLYFERYPKIKDFFESCKEKVRKTGKAVTLLGRERAIPEIHSKNTIIRNQAERLAINTPLQGTSADLIKLAMLAIDKKMTEEQKLGYMVLQIHDALILEIPDTEIEQISSLVKEKMETVFKLKIPLVVELGIGKNWKEC